MLKPSEKLKVVRSTAALLVNIDSSKELEDWNNKALKNMRFSDRDLVKQMARMINLRRKQLTS